MIRERFRFCSAWLKVTNGGFLAKERLGMTQEDRATAGRPYGGNDVPFKRPFPPGGVDCRDVACNVSTVRKWTLREETIFSFSNSLRDSEPRGECLFRMQIVSIGSNRSWPPHAASIVNSRGSGGKNDLSRQLDFLL
jgi:hypothetical protein